MSVATFQERGQVIGQVAKEMLQQMITTSFEWGPQISIPKIAKEKPKKNEYRVQIPSLRVYYFLFRRGLDPKQSPLPFLLDALTEVEFFSVELKGLIVFVLRSASFSIPVFTITDST